MAHKDDRGIWRQDGFPEGEKKPKRCPECGNRHLDYDRLLDIDFEDDELLKEVDWDALTYDQRWDQRCLFSYSPAYAVCEECGWSGEYGPNYYYNPVANTYDLPRPLAQAEIVKAELEAQRVKAESAGQLKLIL